MSNSGGGSPLLWQHLFWFLAHPEVYVLILPAMGIIAEVISTNIRKPLWGYSLMVKSVIFLGFMSFLVWAHHMFLTGMGQGMSNFFAITTMIISVPSVILLTCFILSLYGGSIRYNTPMLFALSFIPMFGIGGLTGLPWVFHYQIFHYTIHIMLLVTFTMLLLQVQFLQFFLGFIFGFRKLQVNL